MKVLRKEIVIKWREQYQPLDSYREEDETLVVSSSLLLGSQLIVTNSTDVIIGEPRDTSIRDENNVLRNRKVDPKSNFFFDLQFYSLASSSFVWHTLLKQELLFK